MNENKILKIITAVAVLLAVGVAGFTLGQKTVLDRIGQSGGHPYAQLEEVVDRYYAGGEYDPEELYTAAAKAYVSSLGDPYSFFYTEEEYTEMTDSRNGQYTGIGITIKSEDGRLVIASVGKDTPASKADLRTGDYLIEVNGEVVEHVPIADIAQYVRLEEGQEAGIVVERGGERLTVTVKAERIESALAAYEVIAGDIAYISTERFYGNAASLVGEFIVEAEKDGCTGIVMDMRDNPGGSGDVLTDMAADFVGKQLVLYMEYKDGTRYDYSGTNDQLTDLPVVILVNENTASAAEAFSGCLRSYDRATIVGTQTFGKGIAQQTFTLSDGNAVTMTVAKYYFPDGTCIHKTGITPDVIVEAGSEEVSDPLDDTQIAAAVRILHGGKEEK